MSLVLETSFNCFALRILSPGHSGYDVLIIKSVGASLLGTVVQHKSLFLCLSLCAFLSVYLILFKTDHTEIQNSTTNKKQKNRKIELHLVLSAIKLPKRKQKHQKNMVQNVGFIWNHIIKCTICISQRGSRGGAGKCWYYMESYCKMYNLHLPKKVQRRCWKMSVLH